MRKTIKKEKAGNFPGPAVLEVERIELSSLANATKMTTCLVPFY